MGPPLHLSVRPTSTLHAPRSSISLLLYLCMFVVFAFLFLKISFSLQKKEEFWKQKQAKQQQNLKLKAGPIMLRNILGRIFNFNLDQFLTLECCYVFLFFCFFLWAETPIFIVFSAKLAKLKEIQKTKKKTLFVNTPVLTVLVKMSVFFCIFDFCCFWNFLFSEMFFDMFPKFKK